MKKLVKKIVVAVMAMAMAIGMLTVSASAAEDNGAYYVVGSMTESNGWSVFVPMTSVGNGVYTYTADETAGATINFKITLQEGWTDEIACAGSDFATTVPEDGKLVITLDTKALGDPTDNQGNDRYDGTSAVTFTAPAAGDATPYVAIAAIAAVALVAVVVLAAKKRTVTE